MNVVIDGVSYAPVLQKESDGSEAAALDVVFCSRDLYKNLTVRDYLYTLLVTLWQQGEGFSGKRPFGNSGWDYDLYIPLIKAGFIPGEIDDDYISDVSDEQAHAFVARLIRIAFYGEDKT